MHAYVPTQPQPQAEHEETKALQGVPLQYIALLQQPDPLPCKATEQKLKTLIY